MEKLTIIQYFVFAEYFTAARRQFQRFKRRFYFDPIKHGLTESNH